MALEDLTGATKYLNALVVTNPDPLDAKSQGDDHIRGIKNVLINTFGPVAAPINVSNLAHTNLAELITGAWKFTNTTIFIEGTSGAMSLALKNTTPTTGKDWRVASEAAGHLAIYDQTLGRYVGRYNAGGFAEVTNAALNLQRADWHPTTRVMGASSNLLLTDAGNQIYMNVAGITLTAAAPNTIGVSAGDLIQLLNVSTGAINLVGPFYAMRGGSALSGNRTLAAESVCTLFADGTVWRVWGNGIT